VVKISNRLNVIGKPSGGEKLGKVRWKSRGRSCYEVIDLTSFTSIICNRISL